ncbi:ATP-binding protein [Magnetospirillum sp. SS-4]|uniref:sensor histidine kinase n=1 Tax=Magnetospirillum sp. SS-4 TaxID=2681465 RepID=UPI001381DB8F|nr:ATP-binding protein [Magnetospirillum sp. SS-4]CAA7613799.1 Sensor histidine kinase [Magnetospirillum sp. SS-4]
MSETQKSIAVAGQAGPDRSAAVDEDRASSGLSAALARGIGLRLLAAIVLFSSLVTLVLTVLQLYLDYRGEIQSIEDRFSEIEQSNLDSLGGSLWSLDTDQIQRQIEGIKRLPDMQYLEVREIGRSLKRRVVVSIGERGTGPVISREYPITYSENRDAAPSETIGVLHMEASLSGVYNRLFEKAVVILISQGVKTFLVALFILYIVYRLVTRHLVFIAGYVGAFNLSTSPPLGLTRRRPGREDELDQVVGAFNRMSAGLREVYRELNEVNAELEEDIAARRKAEEEVIRLNEELEQRVRQRTAALEASNKELDSFTYSVSHDLRAPLRRIEGFGQILNAEYSGKMDDRFRHYLERIRAGAHDMAEMIDSFLKLSRSTRSELTIEPLDLSEMAAKVVERLREKEPQRSVSVTIAPGMTVNGDRRLLDSVLENLLGNAWKYSRHNKAAAISFSVERNDGADVFVVRDNGAGFDMNYLDRLFMPFCRLHRSEEFEGTGIGLATALRILARHGGRVWAEGALGKGATFRFTLWEGGTSHGKA